MLTGPISASQSTALFDFDMLALTLQGVQAKNLLYDIMLTGPISASQPTALFDFDMLALTLQGVQVGANVTLFGQRLKKIGTLTLEDTEVENHVRYLVEVDELMIKTCPSTFSNKTIGAFDTSSIRIEHCDLRNVERTLLDREQKNLFRFGIWMCSRHQLITAALLIYCSVRMVTTNPITQLELRQIQVGSLDFLKPLHSLTSLTILDTNLSVSLPLPTLPDLERLTLVNNSISQLNRSTLFGFDPTKKQPKSLLKFLDIKNQPLKHIGQCTFCEDTNLKELRIVNVCPDFEERRIAVPSAHADTSHCQDNVKFTPLDLKALCAPNLEILHVVNSSVMEIRQDLANWPRLKVVSFNGTQLYHCECQKLDFVRDLSVNITGKCASPPKLKGIALSDIPRNCQKPKSKRRTGLLVLLPLALLASIIVYLTYRNRNRLWYYYRTFRTTKGDVYDDGNVVVRDSIALVNR